MCIRDSQRITDFPYHTRLTAGDSLLISKTGKEPLLYSVYSMKRVMDARQSDAFKVEATLDEDSLVAGVPVTLTVTLHFEESYFLLIRMVFHEERIDTAFSSGENAATSHGGEMCIRDRIYPPSQYHKPAPSHALCWSADSSCYCFGALGRPAPSAPAVPA